MKQRTYLTHKEKSDANKRAGSLLLLIAALVGILRNIFGYGNNIYYIPSWISLLPIALFLYSSIVFGSTFTKLQIKYLQVLRFGIVVTILCFTILLVKHTFNPYLPNRLFMLLIVFLLLSTFAFGKTFGNSKIVKEEI